MAKEKRVPTFIDEGPTVVRSLRIDKDLYEALAAHFREDNRSFTNGVSTVLIKYAREQGIIQ